MRSLDLTFILISISLFSYGQDFNAKRLLVLSDADMAASAYLDGKLMKLQGDEDVLTIIELNEFPSSVRTSTIPISNSVTNWTKSLDASNDGKTAFVAETRGSVVAGVEQVQNVFEDIPAGRFITAVDLEEPANIIAQVDVGNIPLVAQLSPDERWLAATIEEKGREIVILPWRNRKFGKPLYFTISNAGDKEVRATDLTWHPSGKYLAVTLEELGQLVFYSIDLKEERLEQVGEPVDIGLLPGAGQFTPDGEYYLIPDIDDWVTPGYLVSLRPDFEKGRHSAISRIELGRAPEGFGISPNGKSIVVANMEGSHFPISATLRTNHSSLSLISLGEGGQLQEVDRQKFSGILPENVAFDEDGDMIVVAIYDYNDLGNRQGAVEFWEIANNELRYSGTKISVTRGAHVLKLIY